MKKDLENLGFSTRAIHAGQAPDPSTGAIMTPVYLTSTYVQKSPGVHQGYEYSRTKNPTRQAYEDCLASLEGAKFGYAFATGCAATTTVLHMLNKDDHVVCGDDMYGGTRRLFSKVFDPAGLKFSYVDLTAEGALEKAITPATKLVWIETPTNPTMKLIDVKKLAAVCKARGIISVVDNTFMSPYFQRPIELGADIVMHSATKYIGGHSDTLGGFLATDRSELAEKIAFLSNSLGTNASSFDAFLMLRSLKTLPLRMKAHAANAQKVAEFLEKHPQVEKLRYPGLKSDPQYALAQEQMHGGGGMITFWIKGGMTAARSFLENVQLFSLAESLGGVESLVCHPAIMTHASVPAENRKTLGIDDSLIRLSVGVEDVADLIRDLEKGFAAV